MPISPRYAVVAINRLHLGQNRVFGPMNEQRAREFRDGLAKRHPHILFAMRPMYRDTYTEAADVLSQFLSE